MVEFLFLDLDDTILDFQKAERIAIGKTLAQFAVPPTDEVLCRYHTINKWHWEQLELGRLTRQEVLTRRFAVLFGELGVAVDADACSEAYIENLSREHDFLPGAEEAVERLSKKYRLFLASNGNAVVQKGRLTRGDLYRFFEKTFVSEELGANKPSREYFECAFSQIPGFDKGRAMIVGDSLTSDILGGIHAGIKTCWVNPGHAPRRADIQPDYEITSISQLEALLEQI